MDRNGPYWRPVDDVVPNKEPFPTALFGPASEAGDHPGMGQCVEQADIDSTSHELIATARRCQGI
jgi:hypothetical protein